MRVAVDGRALRAGARGVGTYAAGMLVALAREVDLRVVIPRGGRPPAGLPAGAVVRHPAPSRALHGAAAVARRPRLDRLAGGADVVWLLAPAPVAVSRGLPVVLSLLDLSFAERPGDFTPYERAWHALARPGALARRAAAVVAITEDTARRARQRYGLERVDVVAAGPGDPGPPPAPEAVAAVRERFGRFFLFVGALEPRKGLDVLLAADRGDAELVLAGEGRIRAPGAHVLGRVDRAQKAALYAAAEAVVLPSWLEGYGYPPLEGFAHGTPAIVSDLPALRETAGGGAIYVPPGDAAALGAAMRGLTGERRAELARAGAAQLAGRSWQACGRALAALLRRAA